MLHNLPVMKRYVYVIQDSSTTQESVQHVKVYALPAVLQLHSVQPVRTTQFLTLALGPATVF
jgi:hypothetical protein